MVKRYIRHKFHAKPTEVDNIRFDSKLESRHYQNLKLLQKSGEVLFFLRQVGFDLPGKTRYFVDFVEFWKDSVRFVEIKGYDTPMSKLKRKQVEELYPIEITVIKKV